MNERKYGAMLSYINIFLKNGVNFLYIPFLLKYVGQEDYGLFQMTNSTIVSLSLLSMGFSSAYVRFYMRYKHSKNEQDDIIKLNGFYLILFSLISILSLILGGLLVINVQNIFGDALSYNQVMLTRMLMIVLVLNVSLAFISSVFDSNIIVNQKFVFQQSRQLAQTILAPLLAVPLVLVGYGVLSIVIVQTFITILFLVLNIHYCLTKLEMKFQFKGIPKYYLKDIGIFSFFIFLNQVVDMVNNNVPNFILGTTVGAAEVATFSIAIQIKNIFFMLSVSLSSIFVPKVNELVSKNSDKKILTDLMIKVGRVQMAILFFILGGFIVVGKYFIVLWAGSQNKLAYTLVLLMVIPALTPLCQNIGIEIQRAYNKHIFRSVSYVIFAIVNIIITILGTKYYGLIGASFGYIVSLVCANGLLMNWYYEKKMGLDMKKYWSSVILTLIPFCISVLIGMLLQRVIPINSLVSFFGIGIIYCLIYIVIYTLFIANKTEKNILFRR